jgi:ATP-dependent DNA ligase
VGEGWLHEIKHDGYRRLTSTTALVSSHDAETNGGHECLQSPQRNRLAHEKHILDGELVAVDLKGQPAFYELPTAV